MNRLEASTVVHVPPPTAFEFLLDFPGYAAYSEHLESVEPIGDGTAGTVYELTVTWRILSYTVRSTVTDVRPDDRIEWRVEGPLDASGAWLVEPVDGDGRDDESGTRAPGDDPGPSARVRFRVDYDPGSIDNAGIDLPGPLSLDPLVDRLEPIVQAEAERTVERVVADLEGEPRPVTLCVRTGDAVDDGTSPGGSGD